MKDNELIYITKERAKEYIFILLSECVYKNITDNRKKNF